MSAAQQVQPNERIVFFGDSITHAGVRRGGYVDLVIQTIQDSMPDAGIQVVGAGISGNKVPDLLARYEQDVLNHEPTLVVIYIGINDVWHSTRGQGTDPVTYKADLEKVVSKIRDSGARVLLCTTSVIGEKTDGSNSLDCMLEEYSAISRQVGADCGVPVLDLRAKFIDYLKQVNPKNKPHSVLTTDGVHLNAVGNQFVSDCMLEALGIKKVESPSRLLKHVVLFKFQRTTTPAQLQTIIDTFAELPSKIDSIHHFECGTDVSVEGKSKGFTHGFIVTFRTEADRAIYLPHPAHQHFSSVAKPHVEDVLVFDFWTA